MTPRRTISVFALVSYMAAVLLFPVLHRLHHLAHGADHIHTAAGTIYFGAHHHEDDDDHDDHPHDDDDDDHDHGHDALASGAALEHAHHHDADDDDEDDHDAQASGLEHAHQHHDDHDHDALASDAAPGHPHHHHDHAPEDANHGAGSLEHTQASYLCSAPVVLPPPVQAFAHRELLVRAGVSSIDPLALPPIRGPPRTT